MKRATYDGPAGRGTFVPADEVRTGEDVLDPNPAATRNQWWTVRGAERSMGTVTLTYSNGYVQQLPAASPVIRRNAS